MELTYRKLLSEVLVLYLTIRFVMVMIIVIDNSNRMVKCEIPTMMNFDFKKVRFSIKAMSI